MRSVLRVGVLGPLRVERDGHEVALQPGMGAVLAMLVLADGHPVNPRTLAEWLWDENPPASSANIIQSYVSRLRGILGPVPGEAGVERIRKDAAGYRLHALPDELDLLSFRSLVAAARRSRNAAELRSTGDAAQDFALDLYEQALGLSLGEPLAGLEALSRYPPAVAMADERVSVLLEFADTAADAGHSSRALSLLREQAALRPLDEAVHARLMMALAATGRQGEALNVYEALRRRLDGEFGALPCLALRDAHAMVLRQQVPSQRAPGRTASTNWTAAFQLPPASADFTGRAAECAITETAIIPHCGTPGVPVAVVCGLPGVGKTSLALHVAHRSRDVFPDGQLWVPLNGASSSPRRPGDALNDLLRTLGVPGAAIPEDYAERGALYRSRLAGRRVLVVLDDAASADQVRPLMPGTPGCALLATSRPWLEGLDGARFVPLGPMTDQEATDLLARIIGDARVAEEPGAAAELAHACGTLPLALRVVGTRLAARPCWALSEMVRRLADSSHRMREFEASDLSLRSSIAASYDSLPELHRRAFCLLSLLDQADFAEWLTGVLLGDPDAADITDDLAARSLLTPVHAAGTGEPRYRVHDLLHAYAAERLTCEPAAGTLAARKRMIEGFLQLAMTADARLPREPYFPSPGAGALPAIIPDAEAGRLTADPIAWFVAERHNLLWVVQLAVDTGHRGLAAQLASYHSAFHYLDDEIDTAERLWRIIASGFAGVAAGALARLRVGALMVRRGRAADAKQIFDECLHTIERDDDPESLAFALYWRAVCGWCLGDLTQARADAEYGFHLAVRAESPHAQFLNLRSLGVTLARLGDADRAIACVEQAVALAGKLGVPSYENAALDALAHVYVLTGRLEQAVNVCARRIELSRMLGSARGEALSLATLGDIHYRLGDYERALGPLLRALPLFQDQHARRFEALCLLKLGQTYEALGSPDATGFLAESQLIFRELGIPAQPQSWHGAAERR